jgi:hypothetical protein
VADFNRRITRLSRKQQPFLAAVGGDVVQGTMDDMLQSAGDLITKGSISYLRNNVALLSLGASTTAWEQWSAPFYTYWSGTADAVIDPTIDHFIFPAELQGSADCNIKIDLGKTYHYLTGWGLSHSSGEDHTSPQLDIYYSSDDFTWTTAVSNYNVSAYNHEFYSENFTPPISARYVKFRLYGGNNVQGEIVYKCHVYEGQGSLGPIHIGNQGEILTVVAGLPSWAPAAIPTTRIIATTAPITGGGDLSADRTLAIPAATASVNGYATSTQIAKLDGMVASANNYVHPNHTGDVTSTGDAATVIGVLKVATGMMQDASVTLAKMANMDTASLIYRKTAGAGAPEVKSLATLKTDLGLTGTNSGDTVLTPGYIPFGVSGGLVGEDANIFWDNTNKSLYIGGNNPVVTTNPADFQDLSTNRNPIHRMVGNLTPVYSTWRFNGTLASPTALISGDEIGRLSFVGKKNTNAWGDVAGWSSGAYMQVVASDNWANDSSTAYMAFGFSPAGDSVSAEVMRFSPQFITLTAITDFDIAVAQSPAAETGHTLSITAGAGGVWVSGAHTLLGGDLYLDGGATNDSGGSVRSGNIYIGTKNRYGAGGRVGIGTTSPGAALEETLYQGLSTGQNNMLRFQGGQDGSSWGMQWNQYVAKVDTTTSRLTFSGGSNSSGSYITPDVMTLTTAGNVGIGTVSPGSKLDVASGNIRITRGQSIGPYIADHTNLGTVETLFGNSIGSGRAGMNIITSWDGTYDDEIVTFRTHDGGTSEGERVRIDKNGNVGIGTVSPGSKLEVAGDVYGSANCSMLSFTDRTPFYSGDALTEIKAIKGKNGKIDHKTLPEFAKAKHTVLVNGKDTIPPERDLGAMISILTKGVQQLTERIEKFEMKGDLK